MGSESGGSVSTSATFTQALGALKREGSNLLLVGADAPTGHRAACQRLLGETSADPRYRIFVATTEAARSHRCSIDCGYGGEDGNEHEHEHEHNHTSDRDYEYSYSYNYDSAGTTRVITRAATESDEPDRETDPSVIESIVGTQLLSSIGTEVVETITDFEREADGLEPSELRVCVDSIVPLLTDHSPENVFRLLHVLTLRVRQVNGMGHYHLPLEVDHDAVNLLEPLFDAVVEVRDVGGTAQQRWHLRDAQTTSDWISL